MKLIQINTDPNSSFNLCLISIVGTISLSAFMVLPILVGSYIDYLGFSEEAAGNIAAINILGIALMTLVVSLKAQHWPLNKIAGTGLIVMIVSDFLSLYFQTFETFITLRFISGLGGGAACSAVAAAISRLKQAEKGFGIYISFQFMLPALGLFLLPKLILIAGFASMLKTFILLEIISLFFVPLLSYYKIPKTLKLPLDNKFEISILINRGAQLSLLGFCLYGAANTVIWTYVDRMGLSAGLTFEETGNILSITTATAILGAFLVIWLKNNWGHAIPISIGICFHLIAMLILIYNDTTVAFFLGMLIYNLAWAFTWPYFLSIQADFDHTGTLVVAGQFSNLLGNAIGPAIAAFIIGNDGNYTSVIWMSCLIFLLSLALMLAVNRHRTSISI